MKLICFDLDNTLIRSERAHVLAYNTALKRYGFKIWKFHALSRLFGRPHDEVIRILIGKNDRDLIDKINKVKNRVLQTESYTSARIIPGVKRVLRKLQKKYMLAIVSNSSHKNIFALMKGAHLDTRYFTIIVGNDDVRHSKPYPDELFKAEKLVHHKAAFMVGDSLYDILAGKRAGITTVAVLSGRYTRNELKRYYPDFIIGDLKGLLNIV